MADRPLVEIARSRTHDLMSRWMEKKSASGTVDDVSMRDLVAWAYLQGIADTITQQDLDRHKTKPKNL